MATWEQRMAARAAERAAVQRTLDDAERHANNPHALHHRHLMGCSVVCSCGDFQGVTCVVIDDDFDPDQISCEVCGEPRVRLI